MRRRVRGSNRGGASSGTNAGLEEQVYALIGIVREAIR